MAAAFLEQTLAEAKARAGGMRLGTPALQQPQPQPQTKGRVEEVTALRSMASKHLGHLRHAAPTPYPPPQPPLPSRCLSTPPLRSLPSTPSQRSHPATPPQPLTPPLAHGHPPPLLLATPPPPPPPAPQLQQQQPLQVSFELPPRELTLSAGGGSVGAGSAPPTSRAGPLQQSARLGGVSVSAGGAPIAAGGGGGSGSGGGPDSPTPVAAPAAACAAAPEGPPHHPHGLITVCSNHPLFTAHQTLPRLVLPVEELVVVAAGASPATAQTHPLSPSTAAAAAAPPPQPYPHAQSHSQLPMPRFYSTASSQSSRPSTSLSVQDLSLPRPGARVVGSRSPTRGSQVQLLDLSRGGRSSSAGGGGGGAWHGSPAPSAQRHDGGGDAAGNNSHGGVVASPGGRGSTRFHHTVTRWASEAAAAAAAAGSAEGSARLPTGGFKVTRGMLYSVFQELDEFDSGRLTYSAFEQAACKIGMRPAQAKRLFEHLDPLGRGFATMREWSSSHLQRQMEAFTRLYVQATRGADGRPKDITEVRSMHMAIQMAMVKLQLKRSGRAVSLDRLVQAFAYMDRDCNGALNAEEVEDALNSLGIFVTKEVVETIMRTFDKDGNGMVDYYEFVKSIYPTLDSSVYHH